MACVRYLTLTLTLAVTLSLTLATPLPTLTSQFESAGLSHGATFTVPPATYTNCSTPFSLAAYPDITGLTIDFTGSTIDCAHAGRGVEIVGFTGSVTFVGLTVANGSVYDQGGAFHLNTTGGSVTLQDALFASNQAAENGGAVWVADTETSLVVHSCVFRSNTAKHGAGVYASGPHISLSVSGSTYATQNYGSSTGGVLYLNNGVQANVTDDVAFVDNESYSQGGAVWTGNIATRLIVDRNVQFLDSWSRRGGGIYCGGTCFVHDNIVFRNNVCNNEGGGIYVNYGTLVLGGNVLFESNRAHMGGALWTRATTSGRNTVVEGHVVFRANRASTDGGAIHTYGNAVDVLVRGDVLFEGNIAGTYGGALFVKQNAGYIVSDRVRFIENVAKYGGAMAVTSFSSAGTSVQIMDQVFFRGNSASYWGGALVVRADSTLVVSGTVRFEDNVCIPTSGFPSDACASFLHVSSCPSSGLVSIADAIVTGGTGGSTISVQDCPVSFSNTIFSNNAGCHASLLAVVAELSDTVTFTGGHVFDSIVFNSTRTTAPDGLLYAADGVSTSTTTISSPSSNNGGGDVLACRIPPSPPPSPPPPPPPPSPSPNPPPMVTPSPPPPPVVANVTLVEEEVASSVLSSGSAARSPGMVVIYILAISLLIAVLFMARARRRNAARYRAEPHAWLGIGLDQYVARTHVLFGLIMVSKPELGVYPRSSRTITLILALLSLALTSALIPLLNPDSFEESNSTLDLNRIFESLLVSILSSFISILFGIPLIKRMLSGMYPAVSHAASLAVGAGAAFLLLCATTLVVLVPLWIPGFTFNASALASLYGISLFLNLCITAPFMAVFNYMVFKSVAVRVAHGGNGGVPPAAVAPLMLDSGTKLDHHNPSSSLSSDWRGDEEVNGSIESNGDPSASSDTDDRNSHRPITSPTSTDSNLSPTPLRAAHRTSRRSNR